MLLVSEEMLRKIVIETNRYAFQQISSKHISPHSRLSKWKDTNVNEMKQFLGTLIWTGLLQLPSYEHIGAVDKFIKLHLELSLVGIDLKFYYR